MKTNPAASVKYPTLKSGEGFPVWTEADVTAYEKRWPLGTRQQVWLSVLLYTGLRRGDAVVLDVNTSAMTSPPFRRKRAAATSRCIFRYCRR